MQKPLANYLRTHRKRSGLTIAEVAYLVGTEHGSTVSRHERGERSIELDIALMYSLIYGKPVRELFEGRAAQVEEVLRTRAKELAVSLKHIGGKQRVVELLELLAGDNRASEV